jgi:hypothetical protein
MTTSVCIKIPDIPGTLTFTMPGVGQLNFMRDSLDKFPRPSELVLKLLNSINPALAPVYSILKVLDIIQAILNCLTAIPKCFMTLSPGPLISCFTKLFKAFAALIELFPPIVYIRMVRDILVAIRVLLDDILSVVTMIDVEISAIKNTLTQAATDQDPVLLEIGNCAKNNMMKQVEGIQLILTVVGKFIGVILSILELFAALVPGMDKKLDEIKSALGQAGSNVPGVGDFPPLGGIVKALTVLRNLIGTLEAFLSNVLGIATTFDLASIPNLSNP